MHLSDLKKLKRFNDIAVTLATYGFDEILDRLEIPGTDLLRKISPVAEGLTLVERIRSVLEELGPTFVKFGQIMSLRPDLLPEELLLELEKLQDKVPAVETEEILKALEGYLDQPLTRIFSSIETEPVAAASLSQVHRATLRQTGEQVAVKIQRPGIRDKVDSDLAILESISHFLDQQLEELQSYELPELVKTVRRTLLRELDFDLERSNMEVARAYAEGSEITIPRTYEELSAEKVLVMEFFPGTTLRDIVEAPKAERTRVARKGLHAAVRQILADGFFHADPHPGNLLVGPEMELCIIDWGMVGRLTEQDRFKLLELLSAIVDKDSAGLTRSFLHLCHRKGGRIDRDALQRDLLELLDRYHSQPIKEINIGHFLMSLLTLLRDYRLQLPTDLVIMVKALVTADGSARLADPDLNVIEEIREDVHAISRQRWHPGNLWKSTKDTIAGLWYLQRDLPRQLQHIVESIERGELSVIFRL